MGREGSVHRAGQPRDADEAVSASTGGEAIADTPVHGVASSPTHPGGRVWILPEQGVPASLLGLGLTHRARSCQ